MWHASWITISEMQSAITVSSERDKKKMKSDLERHPRNSEIG